MNDTTARMVLGLAGLFFLAVIFGRRKTGPWPVSRKEDERDLASIGVCSCEPLYAEDKEGA